MNAFTHGMIALPLSAKGIASYAAAKAANLAIANAFRAGKSIPEAQAAGDAAYNNIMNKVEE